MTCAADSPVSWTLEEICRSSNLCIILKMFATNLMLFSTTVYMKRVPVWEKQLNTYISRNSRIFFFFFFFIEITYE